MAALQLWETLKESITVYTGLSPATFFTGLVLGLAVYYFLSSLFGSSDRHYERSTRANQEEIRPLPPPVQVGEITEEELKAYDGSDPKKPLLMAIKAQIYDVSQSRMFYGPGGPYALFAGKDASRALAKMSFEDKDLTGDISGLGPFEVEALQDWEYKFMSKYVKVGTVKKTIPVKDGPSGVEPVEASDRDVDKPAENGPSENWPSGVEPVEASDRDVDKPAENGPSENGPSGIEPVEASDRDVDKPAENGPSEKPAENGPSENAAVGTTEYRPSADANKE